MKTMRLKLISGVLSLSLLVGHAESSQANPNSSPLDEAQIMTFAATLACATLLSCWVFGKFCGFCGRRPSRPTEPTLAPETPVTTLLLRRQLDDAIAELQTLGGGGGAAGAAAAAMPDDHFAALIGLVANPNAIDREAIRNWVRLHGIGLVDAVAAAARRRDVNARTRIDATMRLLEALQALNAHLLTDADQTPVFQFRESKLYRQLNAIEEELNRKEPVVVPREAGDVFPRPREHSSFIPGRVVKSYLADDEAKRENGLLSWFSAHGLDIERAKKHGLRFE